MNHGRSFYKSVLFININMYWWFSFSGSWYWSAGVFKWEWRRRYILLFQLNSNFREMNYRICKIKRTDPILFLHIGTQCHTQLSGKALNWWSQNQECCELVSLLGTLFQLVSLDPGELKGSSSGWDGNRLIVERVNPLTATLYWIV